MPSFSLPFTHLFNGLDKAAIKVSPDKLLSSFFLFPAGAQAQPPESFTAHPMGTVAVVFVEKCLRVVGFILSAVLSILPDDTTS